MNRQLRLVLAAAMVALLATSASSLPRFALRTGAKCQTCHVNPTGGGMRQWFGAQYGREELPVPEWLADDDSSALTQILGSLLGVGADFRTLYYTRQIPDTIGGGSSRTENSFWQMQGDLYLNFRVASRVSLYLKKGLYSGFEAYGLLNLLPAKGYLKIGKFLPAYGLRLDDHTAFIRTYTGLSPATGRPELTGAEAGIAPGGLALTAGIYNASDGFGGSGSAKAYLARAEGGWKLSNAVGISVGGNILRRGSDAGLTQTIYGGFGGVRVGDLTLIGEADYVRQSGGLATTTGLILFGEGSYVLTPGVELIAGYDFYDADIDLKLGAQSRYSVGLEFFPLSGVEVRPVYRVLVEEPTNAPNNEFHLLFHLYL